MQVLMIFGAIPSAFGMGVTPAPSSTPTAHQTNSAVLENVRSVGFSKLAKVTTATRLVRPGFRDTKRATLDDMGRIRQAVVLLDESGKSKFSKLLTLEEGCSYFAEVLKIENSGIFLARTMDQETVCNTYLVDGESSEPILLEAGTYDYAFSSDFSMLFVNAGSAALWDVKKKEKLWQIPNFTNKLVGDDTTSIEKAVVVPEKKVILFILQKNPEGTKSVVAADFQGKRLWSKRNIECVADFNEDSVLVAGPGEVPWNYVVEAVGSRTGIRNWASSIDVTELDIDLLATGGGISVEEIGKTRDGFYVSVQFNRFHPNFKRGTLSRQQLKTKISNPNYALLSVFDSNGIPAIKKKLRGVQSLKLFGLLDSPSIVISPQWKKLIFFDGQDWQMDSIECCQ